MSKPVDGRPQNDGIVERWAGERVADAPPVDAGAGDGDIWRWRNVRERLGHLAEPKTVAGTDRIGVTFARVGGPAAGETTPTLSAGVQVVGSAQDSAPCQLGATALQCVIDGGTRSRLVAAGVGIALQKHDVVIVPRFCWHHYENSADVRLLCLDVLDIGLQASLVPGGEPPWSRAAVEPHPGAPESFRRQLLHFKWSDVSRLLDEQRPDEIGDPHDGVVVHYTGGDGTDQFTTPTMDCLVQHIAPGFEGRRRRRSSACIGLVLSGYGGLMVNGRTLNLAPNDVFAIPHQAWQRFFNPSDRPLVLLTVHDTPIFRALGAYDQQPTGGPRPRIVGEVRARPLPTETATAR